MTPVLATRSASWDVRRWAREGMLRAGYWGGCQWTRNGETVASIQMRAEQDRVILVYRHRSGSGEWKDEQYPVRVVRTPFRYVSHERDGQREQQSQDQGRKEQHPDHGALLSRAVVDSRSA